MQLIIITGLPCSGKSTRAKQLHDYLAERIASESTSSTATTTPKYRLHLISDQTQSISRAVYDLSPEKLPAHVRSANASEKDARAALYGAVKRVLSPRDIVILDGLNYIKGWRYQLFCEAKNLRTPSAVLQIGCTVDRARQVNEARLARQRRRQRPETDSAPNSAPESTTPEQQKPQDPEENNPDAESILSSTDSEEPYTPSNFENLVFRYEEPNPMTRWDSPLFTIIWQDTPAETLQTFQKLWDVLAGEAKKVIRPNLSTVQRDKDPGGDYLYLLERETQNIVKAILERQNEDGEQSIRLPRNGGGGGEEEEEELVVELPANKVGLPQLQRHRRAFVALNRGGIGLEAVGKLAVGRLRESFVGYLNDVFEKEG
ncbi:Chromatin associated protein KTI12 [Naviculisporaceae sp. PSN 640]